MHLDLESRNCLRDNDLPQFWPERIWNLDLEALTEFVRYLKLLDKGTILTWAFHTDLVPFLAQLAETGLKAWWFEADRLAA